MATKRHERVLTVFQQIGYSFFLPISVLPLAGIFLGVGTALTNDVVIQAYGLEHIFGEGKIAYIILLILNAVGTAVIVNLPIILAKSVALGMSRSKKIAALLSSGLSFVVMHATINTILRLNGLIMSDGTISAAVHNGGISHVLGIPTLEMGAIGGILTGLVVAYIHNMFHEREALPQFLNKVSPTKLLPWVCTLLFTAIGALSMLVWPLLQMAIKELGIIVELTGDFGIFFFGFIERLLLPFGLHHVFYLPFWETTAGGFAIIDGTLIEGAQNIFYAEILSPNTTSFNLEATKFMAGKYPFMMGGLPGAAFAMYQCAYAPRKKQVGLLLLLAAGASFLTGITEPIELTFLFAAPLLYLIHCALAGTSFLLTYLLEIGLGTTFSCGLLDLALFGIGQGNDKTNWLTLIPLAIFYFLIYYIVFKKVIEKYDYPTPGREIAQ